MESKPCIVIDLSWLRSRPAGAAHLSNRCTYLIPDGLLWEIATADGSPAFARRIYDLLHLNQNRVFVGRRWKSIADEEFRTERPISSKALINEAATDALLRCQADNAAQTWVEGFQSAAHAESSTNNARKKLEFDRLRDSVADHWRSLRPDLARSLSGRPRFIAEACLPDGVAELCREYFPEYSTPDWQARLRVFPDVFAVGRWMRLVRYSVLRRLGGASAEKLRNDWEDFQYGHLASYAGWLLTNDRALGETVTDLFPRVKAIGCPGGVKAGGTGHTP